MGFIKRLLLMVLLSVSFMGGYYLGQKPTSPDVIKWCKDKYQEMTSAAKSLPEQFDFDKFAKK